MYLSGTGVNKDKSKQNFDFATNNLRMVYNSYFDTRVNFYHYRTAVYQQLWIRPTMLKFEDCAEITFISNSRTTIEIQVDGDNYKALVNDNVVYDDECHKFKDDGINENTINAIALTSGSDIPDEACGNNHFISVK